MGQFEHETFGQMAQRGAIRDYLKLKEVARILVQDPLSETTRKERRTLLGLGVVITTIVLTGTVPTKIAAIGVEFSQTHQKSLFYILAAVDLYYILAFSLFAISDYIVWKIKLSEALETEIKATLATDTQDHGEKKENDRIIQLQSELATIKSNNLQSALNRRLGFDININDNRLKLPDRLIRFSNPLSKSRIVFEFWLPFLAGAVSLALLLTHLP
jgi:hypothetical protein